MQNYGMSINDIEETDFDLLCELVLSDGKKEKEKQEMKSLFDL